MCSFLEQVSQIWLQGCGMFFLMTYRRAPSSSLSISANIPKPSLSAKHLEILHKWKKNSPLSVELTHENKGSSQGKKWKKALQIWHAAAFGWAKGNWSRDHCWKCGPSKGHPQWKEGLEKIHRGQSQLYSVCCSLGSGDMGDLHKYVLLCIS